MHELHKAFGISLKEAQLLYEQEGAVEYFESVVGGDKSLAADAYNWVTVRVFALSNSLTLPLNQLPVSPLQLRKLIQAVDQKRITQFQAKEFFKQISAHVSVEDLLATVPAIDSTNDEELTQVCKQVVEDHPQVLKSYQAGKMTVFQFFLGQIMRRTKGSVTAGRAKKTLQQVLDNKA
eukprot:m.80950 g.80950  ORF g.80950 m.80950 type:complete len:178 (-) comp20952_c0_seq6:1845-2378(-)